MWHKTVYVSVLVWKVVFFFFNTELWVLSPITSSLQANIKETEVTIPAKLHNSLIGSKGCLVRSIMEDCGGVHIHFPSEGSGSDKVTIRGPVGEVEKAKKQLLQLAEEKVGGRGELEKHLPGMDGKSERIVS